MMMLDFFLPYFTVASLDIVFYVNYWPLFLFQYVPRTLYRLSCLGYSTSFKYLSIRYAFFMLELCLNMFLSSFIGFILGFGFLPIIIIF